MLRAFPSDESRDSTTMRMWEGGVWLIWLVQLTRLWGVHSDDTCVRQPEQGHCMCTTTTTKHVVDLSKIRTDLKIAAGKPIFNDVAVAAGFHDNYVYSYSPCQNFDEGTCKGVTVCQRSKDGKHLFGVGKLDTAIFSGDYFKGELNVSYSDNDRNATVILKCSSAESGKLEPHGETPPGSMHYEFVLHTKYVCLPSPSHGISTGSILLILFFVALLVYLVGGTLLKHFLQGARGWEQIPNVSFWKDFPSLVRDGVMFAVGVCTPKRTYEAI
ncbi:hypothetical protein LSAT2_008488 [Lamellibrachia satsuma]|nr:hypothetical protein LSAT2_008488 [Lamellibrachia satsuma]